MSLPTVAPSGSTLRRFYNGPVGVTGAAVNQSFDISDLPRAVREDPDFEDNFHIFVRADSGISNVLEDVTFNDGVDGLPAEVVLTLDSDNIGNIVSVEIWYAHSVVR